jgi:hypothetical protein
MPPRHIHVPKYGRDFHEDTRSQKRSIPVSQDDPADAVEVTEEIQDNPWASESGDDRSIAALRNQRHSSSRPRKGVSTHEADVRPSRRQGTTQPRQREPTRSHQTSWDTDSHPTSSSEPSSENASSNSDVGSHHPESPGRDLERKIQRLQRRLASLQHSDATPDGGGDTSAPAKPWKVLYEVECLNTGHVACYLDKPELGNDRDLRHLHWQGSRRVANLKAWTRKQKHPFIVYCMYRCVHEREELSEPREKILVLSRELDRAIVSWLDSSVGLGVYNNNGAYVNYELGAPYLCFYHFQHEARQLMSASTSWSQDALPLLKYIHMSTAATAREAETMFASGKVTAKLMPYLFKPGTLVCFEEFGHLVVCEQASLLTIPFKNGDPQRISYELYTVRIAFDGKFRRLPPFKHRIDFKAVGDQPLDITDLSVQPLSSVSRERRAELKRRGDIFMKCQRQLYVTYPSKGGHEDFVCHHHPPQIRPHAVKVLTAAQVDTRFMVDVEAYHMLHDKEISEASDRGRPISEKEIDSQKGTEEFLLQLPPTIVGFNMTEKKWSTYHPRQ